MFNWSGLDTTKKGFIETYLGGGYGIRYQMCDTKNNLFLVSAAIGQYQKSFLKAPCHRVAVAAPDCGG
jgi:hypothetical protein